MKWYRTGLLILSGALLCGCGTPAIDKARSEFYKGNVAVALQDLDNAEPDDNNRVLFLMERGTILQADEQYEASSDDFISAASKLKQLETYSISQGAASMMVNDTVQSFVGVPFERAMLHNLTALNHFAMGNWMNGAVEARRLIQIQDKDVRGDYPDDAFSRYMAGFGLYMVNDFSNASMQYDLAAPLAPGVMIDSKNGDLAPAVPTGPHPPQPTNYTDRLTCFLLLGRSPSGQALLNGLGAPPTKPPYVELYHDKEYLGRSHTLTDITQLAYTTAQKEALRKAAKTAARIAAKEGVAQVFDHNDLEPVGDLVRIVLIGLLEQPDTRRWETLPAWLAVATVPCPSDLDHYTVVVKTASGLVLQQYTVTTPITHRGKDWVSFYRDIQPSTPPPPSL